MKRSSQVVAGVDVGGTKVVVGLADAEGQVIATRRTYTTREGGPQVVSQIIELLEETLREARVKPEDLLTVGVAVPAVIDQARGIVRWAPNIVGWQQEVQVARPIAAALNVGATLHYDGHAWVMGEHWRGAARGARNVALVVVGTGIGGGMILNGQLHRGRAGVAGAVGWWVTDWRQVASRRRGSEGWLESIASGPAIARASGKSTTEEALAAAREGDDKARDAVARAAEVLGVAVANIASLCDPEVIVLAGGVIVGGADLLLPRIQEIVQHESQPEVVRGLRIVAAELGDDAAWLGAARLALDEQER